MSSQAMQAKPNNAVLLKFSMVCVSNYTACILFTYFLNLFFTSDCTIIKPGWPRQAQLDKFCLLVLPPTVLWWEQSWAAVLARVQRDSALEVECQSTEQILTCYGSLRHVWGKTLSAGIQGMLNSSLAGSPVIKLRTHLKRYIMWNNCPLRVLV